MTIQYEGGYFTINEPLVRGHGYHAHTAADLEDLSHYAVEAVNLIQETPWQVNPFVLAIVDGFMKLGENVTIETPSGEEVILRVERPNNPKTDPEQARIEGVERLPKEEWDTMDKEQRRLFRDKRQRVFKRFEERLGVYHGTRRIYDTATEMSQFEKFYFPHNMDFRTRIYPIPTDLTPQSNDLSKGLLRFARGTTLGDNGLWWMTSVLAAHWGEDKLSHDERVAWVNLLWTDPTHPLADIEKWVDDPIENRGWLYADKPFQFIAVAHEFVWALRIGVNEFQSKQPGNLDGSCNGAQHLSIMARDVEGATATNCRNLAQRHDLYMTVADRVWERVEREAAQGYPLALEWVPKLQDKASRRKVVKRAVMTVPYGVTARGVTEFMIKDKHVSDQSDNQWDAATYMQEHILTAVDEVIHNGRRLQRWFQACAVKCAEAGLPLVWDTPAGSKVTQAYRKLIQKRVTCFSTKFYIYEEPKPGEDDEDFLRRIGMDEKKMGTAAPPNVVHSCDASHLQITVCRMADAGIRDFSMIHDSFGCPFAHMDLMRNILRDTIVDMYSDDYLQTWKASVEKYSGLKMPEPPELGDFDIEEIRDSEFFFS